MLYDTKTGNVATNATASMAWPSIGGMGVDGAEKWLVEPQNETVACSKSVTLKAKAAGAISYKWTKNDEPVSGGENGSLEVEWHRSKTPDTYTVTPVYNVFGSEVEGEAKTCNVTNQAPGLMLIVW